MGGWAQIKLFSRDVVLKAARPVPTPVLGRRTQRFLERVVVVVEPLDVVGIDPLVEDGGKHATFLSTGVRLEQTGEFSDKL